MVLTCDCTDPTATGDTTKTSIGTITLPSTARRIVGIGCYAVGAATMTTAEAATGVFEIEIDNKDVKPAKYPLDVVTVLTSGAVAFTPRIFPVDWDGIGSGKVTFYVTMDMAQTGAFKARGYVLYEKA